MLCVCLFRWLFFHLLSNIIMGLRLPKGRLFRPYILFSIILRRPCHLLPFSFSKYLTLFPIIRPYLHPPTRAHPIKVSHSGPQCIRALCISIRFHRQICSTTVNRNFIVRFFFVSLPTIRECASYHETEWYEGSTVEEFYALRTDNVVYASPLQTIAWGGAP